MQHQPPVLLKPTSSRASVRRCPTAGKAIDLEACFSQLTLDVIGKAGPRRRSCFADVHSRPCVRAAAAAVAAAAAAHGAASALLWPCRLCSTTTLTR